MHANVLYFQQLEQKRWRMDELWTFKCELEMSKSEEPGQMIFSPLYWCQKVVASYQRASDSIYLPLCHCLYMCLPLCMYDRFLVSRLKICDPGE